jgi:ribulose-phosphate 3-epimerase
MPAPELNIALPAIAPSILTADFTRLGQEVAEAARAGAGLLHLDVMDGRFVPNITFGPLVVAALSGTTQLPVDVHLMIDDPERFIDDFVEAGADIITLHVEATRHLHRAIQQIHAHGVRAGVAVNPATPLTLVEEILEMVDLVLVMSVNPGYGGQTFIPTSLEKIARLRGRLEGARHRPWIEVDGGIQVSNARRVVEAGADILVAGSSVFNPDQPVQDALAALRAAAHS